MNLPVFTRHKMPASPDSHPGPVDKRVLYNDLSLESSVAAPGQTAGNRRKKVRVTAGGEGCGYRTGVCFPGTGALEALSRGNVVSVEGRKDGGELAGRGGRGGRAGGGPGGAGRAPGLGGSRSGGGGPGTGGGRVWGQAGGGAGQGRRGAWVAGTAGRGAGRGRRPRLEPVQFTACFLLSGRVSPALWFLDVDRGLRRRSWLASRGAAA